MAHKVDFEKLFLPEYISLAFVPHFLLPHLMYVVFKLVLLDLSSQLASEPEKKRIIMSKLSNLFTFTEWWSITIIYAKLNYVERVFTVNSLLDFYVLWLETRMFAFGKQI